MYAVAETHIVCDVTTASPFLSCQVYIPSITHISKRIYLNFICLYTISAAAVIIKAQKTQTHGSNFSRDCIVKIAHIPHIYIYI